VSVHIRVCRGKDCLKKADAVEALKSAVASCGSVETVKCQDICKGPVALVRRGKSKFWFKKLVGESLLNDLVTFLEDGSMSADLVGALVRKK